MRSSQALLIRQTAELLLQDLLAQSPQVLTQLGIPSLFRWLCDFAIRYDLQPKTSARLPHQQQLVVFGRRNTYILSLNLLRHNIFTGRSK